MAEALTVTLPYPPSANSIWRAVGKKVLKSAEYRAWLEAAGWQVRASRPGCVEGPYAMHIRVSRPDRRARDLDNLIKPVADLCKHAGLITDDKFCQRLTAEWSAQGEGVRVTIISTTET